MNRFAVSKFRSVAIVAILTISSYQASTRGTRKGNSWCPVHCDGSNSAVVADQDLKSMSDRVRFIDFELLKSSKSIPLYNPSKCKHISTIDRRNSLLIFVSHRWLRSLCQPPHPDDADGHHYELLVKGIESIKQHSAPNMENVYVWIDYSCMDLDHSKDGKLTSALVSRRDDKRTKRYDLTEIISVSDLVFTPLFEPEAAVALPSPTSRNINSSDNAIAMEIYEGVVDPNVNRRMESIFAINEFPYQLAEGTAQQPSTNSPSNYLQRAWCLLELFLSTYVPLANYQISRAGKFSSQLRASHEVYRRPHYVYTTSLMKNQQHPIRLPVLDHKFFLKYVPNEGETTFAHDMQLINRIRNTIPMHVDMNTYVGGRDITFMPQGAGRMKYADGSVYMGEFLDGREEGRGIYYFADGDKYEGEFKRGNINGQGTYYFAKYNEYHMGQWMHGLRNGYGITFDKNHDIIYEGEFLNDQRHGQGIVRSEDKKYRLRCNFVNGLPEGKCEIVASIIEDQKRAPQ